MQLFSTKKLSYLGVDLGNAGVKVVELKNESGRPRLATYGYLDLPSELSDSSFIEKEDEIAALVKKVCLESKVTTKKAVASLPNFSVFSSVLSLPQMKKEELDQAVYWEAKKFVPIPIEEMNLYWEIISKKKEDEGKGKKAKVEMKGDKNGGIKGETNGYSVQPGKDYLKILVVAAPKKVVAKYMSIFNKAGLELLNLETESFALERSLVGHEESPVMIVDIGSISTDITIIDKMIPVLNRSVDTGGSSITKKIASSLGVDFKRAEQFKRDVGFSGSGGGQGVPKVIEGAIEPIVNEIKYCFDLYFSQEGEKQVEKIVLTGGSAFLPNLSEYLSKLLNIKVIIGDPWSRVIYPVELKPMLDDLAPRLSVAVGLAMREIE